MRRVVIAAMVLAGGAVAACGNGEPDPRVIRAGQADIQLPDGWTVRDGVATRPPKAAAAVSDTAPGDATGAEAASPAGNTTDTVPLSEDDPQTAFFKAASVFQTCLDEQGFEFIGVPDANNPASPTNDPDYLSALGTCASKSNILQALENVRKFEDAMSPDQIEERNEQYLAWRECMIDKGWGIPDPVPDERGRLFSFSGAAEGGGPQIEPPAGESLLDSDDFGDCIEEASA